ncbi:hypothetical protein Dimus_012262 [Dionaea muscipula]
MAVPVIIDDGKLYVKILKLHGCKYPEAFDFVLQDGLVMGSPSQIAISVEKKLSSLPFQSTNSCIYRVPENLRKTNEEAYRPMVVSIGPFHHGDPKLLPMQEQKLSPAGDEFIEMVLLDSAFIIETFLRGTGFHSVDPPDRVFLRPKIICQVVRDLKLLENQLPFFIIEKLYEHIIKPNSPREYFRTVTCNFINLTPRVALPDIKHFVDLLRTCSLPSTRRPEEVEPGKMRGKIGFRVSITNLKEAGISYKMILNLSSEIWWHLSNAIIPLTSYIIDYVALLDFLIQTPKDVELLIEQKILENWLGNSEEAANVFNNLFKQVTIASSNFYYSSLCGQLERYYNTQCHKHMAMLKHDYFRHPWAIISFIFAILLFILALIQAVAGVLSLRQSGGSSSSKH